MNTASWRYRAHALYLRKLKGLRFAVGAFTNLSQDHLDDFKTMENYAAAKARFFQAEMIDCAVMNADDPASEQMLADWHARRSPIPLRERGSPRL